MVFTKKKKFKYLFDFLVKFLLIWISFQDFILPLFLRVTNNIIVTLVLFYLKDAIFISLFAYCLYKGCRKSNLIYLLYLLISFVFFFAMSKVSLMELISSLRTLLLLPAFIEIGRHIINKRGFKKFLNWYLMDFLLFFALFGILDYFLDITIGTKSFWTDFIGLGDYMIKIKGQGNRLVMDLPGNFYGSYGHDFFSQKRLVSFWASPLTAGYILIIPFVFGIFSIKKNQPQILIKIIIFAIALFLTNSRIMIVCAFVAVLYCIYKRCKNASGWILFFLIIVFLFCFFNFNRLVAYFYDGSTIGHIIAVENTLIGAFSLFGKGVASFGISGALSTESFYISIIGQLGFVGLVLYFLVLVRNFECVKKKNYKTNKVLSIIKILMFVYLSSGLISEQLGAFTTIAPAILCFGFASNNSNFTSKVISSANSQFFLKVTHKSPTI